jgi:hypothetical protein
LISKELQNELSILIKSNISRFKNLVLNEDELNIDKYLKLKVNDVIYENINEINQKQDTIVLNIYTKDEFKKSNNKIPNHISKFFDLIIETKDENDNTIFEEIEIKKTNNNIIPGSSIQQIDPYKTVVFFQYKKDDINVEVGYYTQCLTDNYNSHDRSPRPKISFNNLKNSNDEGFKVDENEDIEFKRSLFSKDFWIPKLVDMWIKQYKNDKYQRGWFIKALNLFADEIIKDHNKNNN